MAFLPSNYWLCRDLSENTASQIQWTSMLDFFVLVHIKSPFIEVNPHFQTQSYPVFIGYIIIFEAWIPVLVRVSLHVWWSVVSLHLFFLYRKSLLQLRIRCQESAYQGGRSRWLVLSRQSSVPKNAHTQRYIMIIAILLWRSIFYLLWLLLSLYIVVISSAKSLFMLSLHIILPYILPISFHYIYGGPLSPVFAVIWHSRSGGSAFPWALWHRRRGRHPPAWHTTPWQSKKNRKDSSWHLCRPSGCVCCTCSVILDLAFSTS